MEAENKTRSKSVPGWKGTRHWRYLVEKKQSPEEGREEEEVVAVLLLLLLLLLPTDRGARFDPGDWSYV
jgi:hypothetical protein